MEKCKMVAVKLEEDVDRLLREKAADEGVTMSDLIRLALYELLEIPVSGFGKRVRA